MVLFIQSLLYLSIVKSILKNGVRSSWAWKKCCVGLDFIKWLSWELKLCTGIFLGGFKMGNFLTVVKGWRSRQSAHPHYNRQLVCQIAGASFHPRFSSCLQQLTQVFSSYWKECQLMPIYVATLLALVSIQNRYKT